MSRSLWVDPEGLHARGAAMQEIGDEIGQVVARLRAALDAEGRWWGDDEAGKAFEKTYEPDARQAVAALAEFAASVDGFGRDVMIAAENFQIMDQVGGKQIEAATETDAGAPLGGDLPAEPVRAPDVAATPSSPEQLPLVAPQSDADQVAAEAMPLPTKPLPHNGFPDPAPNGGNRQGSRGVDGGADPQAAPAGAGSGDRAVGQDRRRPVEPIATSNAVPPSVRQADRPAGSEKKPATAPAPGGPTNTVAPPRAGASPPAVSAPSARRPPGTPWSGGAPSAGSPAGSPPPVARPDRPAVSPPAGAKRPVRAGRPVVPRADRDQQRRSSRQLHADSEIARLARELADRHGIAVSGLDTPGIHEAYIRAFLAAVVDVLTKFPVIALRHVGIAPLGDHAIARVERRSTGVGNAASTWSADLNATLLADAARLAEAMRAADRPGSVVAQSDIRPVYTATVREFGRAFDLAGAGQARARAQRALIAEYLADGGHRRVGLARVVRGYLQWRDQLSGSSFDKGRFDAPAALAAAFTDVMLNGDRATEPAQTLCRLLVDTARPSATAGTARPGDGEPRRVRRTDA
ncbi:hypothetical protein [Nocardia sp. NPDC049149]|uniref:hypothetical protein n=1 Tax=Nocardia sp. NPDC049149 TaxID=3364315 RepID=UPI00371126E4